MKQAYRGAILHCLDDPGNDGHGRSIEYFDDGLLIVVDGYVAQVGEAGRLLAQLPEDAQIKDYGDSLIMPGFIDTHIHYPQTDMIGAYGEQLLTWLTEYTYPTERQFADAAHAAEVAEFFVDELLRNGTTTALVLGTVHTQSVDAVFEAAATRRLRLIAGKVLMDRNCPDDLRDTPDEAYQDSKRLIERWHGQDRLMYAITPRFAPTSSDAQLQRAGQLATEHTDVFVHTHVAENRSEVDWVAKLFPQSRSYLDVYDQFGLLRERSVFAHCIHLDNEDRRRLATSGASMAFCPTSNLFLGSGLFDLAATQSAGTRVGLGTDVGAGTSFSILRTLGDAYKVAQLTGGSLSPFQALYLATLGAAKALYIDDKVGNFAAGKEADFIVLKWDSTPLLTRRMRVAQSLAEKLFALLILGDDRAIFASYIMGEIAYAQDSDRYVRH